MNGLDLMINKDIGFNQTHNNALFCDNKAAILTAANSMFHVRIKHVEIDYHLLKEKIQEGIIKTQSIHT